MCSAKELTPAPEPSSSKISNSLYILSIFVVYEFVSICMYVCFMRVFVNVLKWVCVVLTCKCEFKCEVLKFVCSCDMGMWHIFVYLCVYVSSCLFMYCSLN